MIGASHRVSFRGNQSSSFLVYIKNDMFLLRQPVHIVIRNQSVRDGIGALIFWVFFRHDTSGQGGRRIENTPPVVDHMSLQDRRGDRVRQDFLLNLVSGKSQKRQAEKQK